MGRPSLTLTDRARGLLLGLGSGHALGLTIENQALPQGTLGSPSRVPGNLARLDTADSPWGDHVALAALLSEELVQPEIDLSRLVEHWIAWWRRDGRGLDSYTADALEHFAQHDAPAGPRPGGGGAGPLARTLPIALAMFRSPRNLVSGTYHTVLLTHPDSETAWAAVSVNVAVSQFMHGRRDVLPDVVDVLQANDASPDLLALVRRIPFIGRDELATSGHSPAVACAELALWCAHHETSLESGVAWVAAHGRDPAATAAVVGGVLGAREGEDAIPAQWIDAVAGVEALRGLAKRLVALRPAAL